MEIGKRIKEARQIKGYNQEKLAWQFQLSVQAVSKWECGQSFPDISLLPQIADFLQVSLDYLLRDECEKIGQLRGLPADDKIRIVQCVGDQIVAKTEAMENEDSVISLYIPTDDNRAMNTQMNVEIWGNAKVNGVICGDVRAEKNLTCSKVNGNISAGGNVTCENVNGEVYAGGEVSGFEI